MQISEIKIKLVENRTDRLKAFSSVTFDDAFVVRDLKIIEGTNGYFVAMPSRKLTDRCPSCGSKNHLRARFCNDCGARLDEARATRDGVRMKLHADVAHPINSESREMIQASIVEAFHEEIEKSKEPGYRPPRLDDLEEDAPSYGRGPVSPPPPPEAVPEPEAAEPAEPEPTAPPAEEEEEPKKESESTGFSEGIF